MFYPLYGEVCFRGISYAPLQLCLLKLIYKDPAMCKFIYDLICKNVSKKLETPFFQITTPAIKNKMQLNTYNNTKILQEHMKLLLTQTKTNTKSYHNIENLMDQYNLVGSERIPTRYPR